MVDFKRLLNGMRSDPISDEARKACIERTTRELIEMTIEPPSRLELWHDLVSGTLTVHDVRELLQEVDLWCVPGLYLRTALGTSLVLLANTLLFEEWLSTQRPHLLEEYHIADAARMLCRGQRIGVIDETDE